MISVYLIYTLFFIFNQRYYIFIDYIYFFFGCINTFSGLTFNLIRMTLCSFSIIV